MAKYTWIYTGAISLIAFVLVAFTVPPIYPAIGEWRIFFVLTTLSMATQVISTATPSNQLRVPQMIFFFAGVLLLPPLPLLMLILIPILIDWERNKREGDPSVRDTYVLPFRISTHIVGAFCAHWLLVLLPIDAIWSLRPKSILSIVAVATLYALLHHGIGRSHSLLQGLNLEESGLLDTDRFFARLAILFIGYGVAILWLTSPWLILLSVLPGLFYYQVYVMPKMRKEAYTDAKTGLSNMRHFDELFVAELNRAARLNQPLAVIMLDVDDLGVINNTYGHLAGDGALLTVSEQIRRHIRPGDIAARLGGEEFCVIVSDTREQKALVFANELRKQIAQATFHVSSTSQVLQTTVSIGIAVYPQEGVTTLELIHSADVAMYQAKMKGKNRVVSASQMAQHLRESSVRESTEVVNYRMAFSPKASGGSEQLGSLLDDEAIQVINAQWNTPVASAQDGGVSEALIRPRSMSGPALTGHRSPPSANGTRKKERSLAEPSDYVPSTTIKVSTLVSPLVFDSAVIKYQSEVGHVGNVHRKKTSGAVADHGRPNMEGAAKTNGPLTIQGHTPRSFIYGTLTLGILAAVLGLLSLHNSYDLATLVTFGMVALFVQLLQLSMYDSSTISVSAAAILAGTIIAGTPGLLVTSSVVVLVHSVQYRPKPYKIAFNWAVHILAGLAPLAVYALNLPYTPRTIQIQAALVLIAAIAYYVIESFLIAAAIALSKNERIITTWENHFRWLAVHYLVSGFVGLSMALAYKSLGVWGVLSFIMPVLFMYFSQKQYIVRAKKNTEELNEMNQELSAANKEIRAANQAMHQQNDELFLILSKIIDARDPDIHGHASQVANYATSIAQELGLMPEEISLVHKGALLHDIGKLGIAEAILYKPGPLTDEEYEIIKEHPIIGAELLETCQILRSLIPYVRHHHERWDGCGYPAGLAKQDIPLGARIVAVCDAVEAMASDRPYRQGLSVNEIIQELDRCKGKQFDPAVIDAFTRVLSQAGQGILKNTARSATMITEAV